MRLATLLVLGVAASLATVPSLSAQEVPPNPAVGSVVSPAEAPTAWLFDAARSFDLFGPVSVTLDAMIAATAHWVQHGGATLGRPTHFETRDGQF